MSTRKRIESNVQGTAIRTGEWEHMVLVKWFEDDKLTKRREIKDLDSLDKVIVEAKAEGLDVTDLKRDRKRFALKLKAQGGS